MKTQEQVKEDTVAVMTTILQTRFNRELSDEDRDALKAGREAIYADYEPEDLKRMVRNIAEIFFTLWGPFAAANGTDPFKAWQDSCTMTTAVQELKGDGNENPFG